MRITSTAILLSILLLSDLSVCSIAAEDIYRSQSKSGSISFSNKHSSAATVATLPPIIKTDKISAKTATSSCSGHNGFDCARGADSDGSVICYDGFKDSLQRFSFSCGKAKLKLLEQSLRITSSDTSAFLLRNLTSVDANNIQIKNKNCKNITGPKDIAAYDSAEFVCYGKIKNPSSLEVSCDNC